MNGGAGTCIKSKNPHHCLIRGPDYVYITGMIYASWTSSRPGSDGGQMRDLYNSNRASFGKKKVCHFDEENGSVSVS